MRRMAATAAKAQHIVIWMCARWTKPSTSEKSCEFRLVRSDGLPHGTRDGVLRSLSKHEGDSEWKTEKGTNNFWGTSMGSMPPPLEGLLRTLAKVMFLQPLTADPRSDHDRIKTVTCFSPCGCGFTLYPEFRQSLLGKQTQSSLKKKGTTKHRPTNILQTDSLQCPSSLVPLVLTVLAHPTCIIHMSNTNIT